MQAFVKKLKNRWMEKIYKNSWNYFCKFVKNNNKNDKMD